jgi:16S rRNA (adenine1518-N6/adenine1519-N6)-dimethyltransferase
LAKGATVITAELDPVMAAVIRQDFASFITSGQLTILEGDALHTLPACIAALPSTYKVVANIPYQITTPLLELFLEKTHPPALLSLLVQRELGERLAAKPATGERSFLSVLAQHYAEVAVLLRVPPAAFFPAPSVDSAVIQLKVRAERSLPKEIELHFLRFVRMAFQQRRKQLKNVLAAIQRVPVATMEAALGRLGFPSTIRAQELSEEQWLALFEAWQRLKTTP